MKAADATDRITIQLLPSLGLSDALPDHWATSVPVIRHSETAGSGSPVLATTAPVTPAARLLQPQVSMRDLALSDGCASPGRDRHCMNAAVGPSPAVLSRLSPPSAAAAHLHSPVERSAPSSCEPEVAKPRRAGDRDRCQSPARATTQPRHTDDSPVDTAAAEAVGQHRQPNRTDGAAKDKTDSSALK